MIEKKYNKFNLIAGQDLEKHFQWEKIIVMMVGYT